MISSLVLLTVLPCVVAEDKEYLSDLPGGVDRANWIRARTSVCQCWAFVCMPLYLPVALRHTMLVDIDSVGPHLAGPVAPAKVVQRAGNAGTDA